MAIRVKDLTDQIGTPGPRPVLLCEVCHVTYSAHKGDYWTADPNHVFMCCGVSMVLARKRVIYDIVQREEN